MTNDERDLLQKTNDRILRAAAALERIARQLEERDVRDMTVMHSINTQLSAIKEALGLEERMRHAIEQVTGEHRLPTAAEVHGPDSGKTNMIARSLGAWDKMSTGSKVLFIVAVVSVMLTVATLIAVGLIHPTGVK